MIDLAAKRSELERDRKEKLRHLGVSKEALAASELKPISDRPLDCIRIMTWNLLADGMSDDGFLMNDVLQEWPAGAGNVPTADGEVVKFRDLLEQMIKARSDTGALERLKQRFDMKIAKTNAEVIVDWQARELQIQLQVLAAGRPDVLVFQECDHFGTLRQGLAKLGYCSSLPSISKEYEPAHLVGFNTRETETGAQKFREAMEQKGYSFLPNVNSTAMNIKLNTKSYYGKVVEAAKSLGILADILEKDDRHHHHSCDDSKEAPPPEISRNAFCGRGSGKLLEEASIDPLSIDDDGVAIFWRGDRFAAQTLSVRVFPGGNGGALQVRLRERSCPAREILAIGAHLGSGDDPKSEERRLTEQVDVTGGLTEMVQEACHSGHAVVLCMDANSHPQIGAAEGSKSVWRSLHKALGASVWDGHFDITGSPIPNGSLDPPVTSNKLRGPLSGQAKKMGLHAYYCIDHIFFTPAQIEFKDHPLKPRQFTSDAAAREVLNPSLSNPSDHYPIVADLAWPLKGGSQRLRVSAGKPVEFYVRAAISILEGAEDGVPVRELYISGLSDAITSATKVAQCLQRDGHGSIGRIHTDYPEISLKNYRTLHCPQIVIVLHSAKS